MAPAPADDEPLDAGGLAPWLDAFAAALRGERASEVPCDGCTACCTSSQFVHIEPDETATLARIPPALLFPAPRLPVGHVLLGYDERGHCPMLLDGRCSIYEDRPRTCRTYDCRVLAVAGVGLDDPDKPAIAARARRWRFALDTPAEDATLHAVRAAAAFLEAHGDEPDLAVPRGAGPRAVLAFEIHRAFLGHDPDGRATVAEPSPRDVRVEIARRTRG